MLAFYYHKDHLYITSIKHNLFEILFPANNKTAVLTLFSHLADAMLMRLISFSRTIGVGCLQQFTWQWWSASSARWQPSLLYTHSADSSSNTCFFTVTLLVSSAVTQYTNYHYIIYNNHSDHLGQKRGLHKEYLNDDFIIAC